ncbi:MAG TPA: DMT family transporter [Pyrinomonadaceae bacterium]|nr:DMT family transporter [Pyrinomonadaceae bacterium]
MSNSRSNTSVAPHLALIAVQILFATWPIVGKVALRTIPPFALVGFRIAGATILLIVLARLRGRLKPIRRHDWPLLIVSSALGLILNQWLFVKGLSWTTAINSTLISTSIPVATLLVGIVLGTDRATWRRIIGIVVSAAGVLMLIGPGRASFSTATRAGDLLIVANSFCYGAYIAVSKDIVRRYSALNVITWIFVIASIATIPAGVYSLSKISVSGISIGVWFAVAYIIILPTAGAYFLNAWALARVPPSTVAVYIYLQPLFAFVLAPVVLGESLSPRAIVSSLLIFAGVLVVTRRRKQRAEVASTDQVINN